MRFSASDARGFTLMETFIAVFILAFGLMAGAELIALVFRSASLARSKGAAATIAESKLMFLTDLYRGNPNAADLAPGNHGPEEIEIRNRAANCILNRYAITWTIAAVPDPRPGKVLAALQVSVTVYPIDADGKRHLISWMNKGMTLSAILSARLLR